MPNIRPSADLRNSYNEISEFCHNHAEPIFITRNGRGDLAVMSIEKYEEICGKLELYKLIDEGIKSEENGDVSPYSDVVSRIRQEVSDVQSCCN